MRPRGAALPRTLTRCIPHLAIGSGEADMDSRGAQASHGPAHDTMPNKERGLWAQSRNASSGHHPKGVQM